MNRAQVRALLHRYDETGYLPPIGGGARPLERQVDSFNPTLAIAGQRRPMPLGVALAGYKVRVTGTFTVGTNPVTPYDESPYGLLPLVQLQLGTFPLRYADARFYRFFDRLSYGTDDQFTAPNGTGLAATNIAFEFKVDLQQQWALPPINRAFWLDTRRVSSLSLVFDVGNQDDVTPANGGAAANTLTGTTILTTSEEIADRGGPTSRLQIARFQYSGLVVGDNDLQATALGPAYVGVLFKALSGNTSPFRATSDDTIINTASIIADSVRVVDQYPYAKMRQDLKSLFQFEVFPAGWAGVWFAKSKTLQDVVQTGNRRTMDVRVNIAALPANSWLFAYLIQGIILTAGGQVVQPAARRVIAATRRP